MHKLFNNSTWSFLLSLQKDCYYNSWHSLLITPMSSKKSWEKCSSLHHCKEQRFGHCWKIPMNYCNGEQCWNYWKKYKKTMQNCFNVYFNEKSRKYIVLSRNVPETEAQRKKSQSLRQDQNKTKTNHQQKTPLITDIQ